MARCTWPGGAREVRDPRFPRQSCVTHRAATAQDAPIAPGPARIVEEGAGWLTVEAEGPGWLVTTQPWYPGWSAQSPSGALAVEPIDGALVGVALPPGPQTVALRYRPASLDRGLVVSGLALLAVAALWWLERRRLAPRSRISPLPTHDRHHT